MKKLLIDSTMVGFALFSMYFGAGNIIFPPIIGLTSGTEWLLGALCYYFADVGLAIITIFAMLRGKNIDKTEGLMYRLGKIPAIIMMAAAILCIGPLLAIPRTGATTFEMAIVPLFGNHGAIVFSIVYFAIVYLFSMKESSIVDIIGKYLTPCLFAGLLLMIIVGIINPIGPITDAQMRPDIIWFSISSGYQTLDVLASMIFGLIIVNALKAKGYSNDRLKFISVSMASLIAGFLLLIVYIGLCYIGATVSELYSKDISYAQLVISIINNLFGNIGVGVLGITVTLACLTTAIALTGVAGTFFSNLTNGRLKYNWVIIAVCIFSAIGSNFGLNAIIAFAVPILTVLYPGTLVVVILSLFNDHIKNDNIFKFATAGAMLVSLCEVLNGHGLPFDFINFIPLHNLGFAWILPAVVLGIIGVFIKSKPVKA